MQGQRATSVIAFDVWRRPATAATTPAINAAAKRLDQWIGTEAGEPAAGECADGGAGHDQQQARHVESAINDAKRSRANGCEQSETWRGSWRQAASRHERGLRYLRGQRAVADLIHHPRDGQHPAHIDAQWLGWDDLKDGCAVDFDDKFAPVRQHLYRHAERAPKPLGDRNRPFCGLPVSEQERGCQRGVFNAAPQVSGSAPLASPFLSVNCVERSNSPSIANSPRGRSICRGRWLRRAFQIPRRTCHVLQLTREPPPILPHIL